MTQIESIAALVNYVGKEVGVSDWLEVSQERIDQFAEASEDRQWIHLDRERAARESPFKNTIAHGFLTLSLLSALARLAISVGGVRMGINYGIAFASFRQFPRALAFADDLHSRAWRRSKAVCKRRGT